MLSGIILAGGRSSRMGRPKALLPFDNEPLISHIVRRLQPIVDEIVVVAAPDQQLPSLPVRLVRDEVAYQGPVGGISYGLAASTGEFSFVTSCDAAFSSRRLIDHLLSLRHDADVVVPRWDGRYQPLFAIYRRTVLPLLEAQLERGELRPVTLFERVNTCTVEEEEIRAFDPDGESFFNMNEPADYERAVARWNATRGRAKVATS